MDAEGGGCKDCNQHSGIVKWIKAIEKEIGIRVIPVKHNVMIEPISEDEFHLLDHKIMGIVFSMHKELPSIQEQLEPVLSPPFATRTRVMTTF